MINPCEEGTHDCFANNFVNCVFVANEQFRCENCKTGYLNETNSDGDTVCTGKSCIQFQLIDFCLYDADTFVNMGA